MKATNSLPSAPLVLRLVGIILIVSSLIDYLAVLIPPNFGDKAWFATAITQMVDRGIIPMVGLALLFASAFLESGTFALPERKSPVSTFRFWALLLSLLLGIAFLVFFPLYLNTNRQIADQNIKEVDQRANAAKDQVNAQIEQRAGQISSALQDPNQVKQLDEQIKQINEAISTGRFQGKQLSQAEIAQAQAQLKELQALKSNPNAVNTRANEVRSQRLIEIEDQRKQAKEKTEGDFKKSSARVGLSSLLLSFGYLIIGWSGLRELGVLKGKRRPAMR